MVKHVILWQLKDELDSNKKALVRKEIKEGLESLAGKIPGLISIKVNVNLLHLQMRILCWTLRLQTRLRSRDILFIPSM